MDFSGRTSILNSNRYAGATPGLLQPKATSRRMSDNVYSRSACCNKKHCLFELKLNIAKKSRTLFGRHSMNKSKPWNFSEGQNRSFERSLIVLRKVFIGW